MNNRTMIWTGESAEVDDVLKAAEGFGFRPGTSDIPEVSLRNWRLDTEDAIVGTWDGASVHFPSEGVTFLFPTMDENRALEAAGFEGEFGPFDAEWDSAELENLRAIDWALIEGRIEIVSPLREDVELAILRLRIIDGDFFREVGDPFRTKNDTVLDFRLNRMVHDGATLEDLRDALMGRK